MDTGIDTLKTVSKKKYSIEATGEFIGNKIADKIVKSFEEIIIPSEKREGILKELRQVL